MIELSHGQCKSINSYSNVSRIGEGTYGMVYRAIEKITNEIVALKKIILHNEKNEGFPITSIREIATLREINHPNCVKLLDVVVGNRRDGVFLVFEYCEHDLSSLLSTYPSTFTESESKSIVFQLLSAIKYLHEHWIIHRDIKLSNILYNNRGEVKLADFGLARKYSYPSKQMTTKVVTLWYRAPELLLGAGNYTTSIDIWAIGCVMAELLLNKPLFPGDDELSQIDHIFSLLGTPTQLIWPTLLDCSLIQSNGINLQHYQEKYRYNNLRIIFPQLSSEGFDFLIQMLTYDPKQRIIGRNALRHIYFQTSPYPKEPDLMPTFRTQHITNTNQRNSIDLDEGINNTSTSSSSRKSNSFNFSNSNSNSISISNSNQDKKRNSSTISQSQIGILPSKRKK